MDGNFRMSRRIFSWLGTREVNGRRIIVGLKSDNYSREMLLSLLHFVVVRGDSVLAVHVQKSDESFDPNTFHIHEDLCKSKQVDFEVKICSGSCHITELSHQVRITFATILAVGCSDNCPKNPSISKWLKALPPTCTLLIMDNGGKVLCRKMGTSQEGTRSKVLQPSMSSLSEPSGHDGSGTRPMIRKSLSMPSPSTTSTSEETQTAKPENYINFSPKLFHRLAMLEAKGYDRHFTFEELNRATKSFGRNMLIGEGVHSLVYKAVLENGQAAAVKVLKTSQYSEELFFREVEILSGLKHDNIIQLIGFCCCKKMYAIVYNLLNSSLKQRLNQLKWSERMQLAVGVAKALEYLHSRNPPIVHKDVNSSNILLSEDGKPQLSDFGAARVQSPTRQPSPLKKPIHVIGRLGYLAPEYVMYGKVDEKIDVYSYGVVLLELTTGRAAFQTSPVSNEESLVLWARSLVHCGLYETLIDPNLKEDYNKDEMRTIMIAARLCLLHSSSRRPTMKTILSFLEEPNNMLGMQEKRQDLLSEVGCKDENDFSMHADSDASDSLVMDNA